MFGGMIKLGPRQKPLSPYEQRAKEREAEYARHGLDTYEEQQRHEERKALLGLDYRDRYTGSWKKAEEHMKRCNQTFYDWLWD
jgi:hypothetical protein